MNPSDQISHLLWYDSFSKICGAWYSGVPTLDCRMSPWKFYRHLANPKSTPYLESTNATCQFENSVVDQDVRWLEIPMNHSVLQQLQKPFQQIRHHLHRILLKEIFLLLDEMSQISSVAVFLDHVVIVPGLQEIDHSDHVLVIQLLHNCYFVAECSPQVRIRHNLVFQEDFYSHFFFSININT